jgi:hypothetical protein
MANTDLSKTVGKIFGGSAIAGMGFALGRDVYSNTKNDKNFRGKVLAIFILGISIFGVYSSGVLIARNYKGFWSGFFHRLLGLVILVPSLGILCLISAIIFESLAHSKNFIKPPDQQAMHAGQNIEVRRAIPVSSTFQQNSFNDPDSAIEVRRATPVSGQFADQQIVRHALPNSIQSNDQNRIQFSPNILIFPSCILGIGLISGLAQRRKRRNIWRTEELNKTFLEDHHLQETENSNIKDQSTGQVYRIQNIQRDGITLFPIGRRSKRAYILIDNAGRFQEYTGMVEV